MKSLSVVKVEVETSPGTWTNLTNITGRVGITRADGDLGTCSVRINDDTLDPTKSSALASGRPLRIMAKNGASWSPVFTGTIDTCPVEYKPQNPVGKRAFITINSHDNVARLSELTESRGVGTITALRWLMKDSGIPFVVNGNVTSLPTGTVVSTNENSNMWAQVLVTRDSALGYVHVDVMNRLCAWDNTARSTTPTVTLRPSDYSSLDTDFNPDDVINSVTVNWLRYDVGSDATSEVPYGPYEDAASIAQFGRRSAAFTIGGPTESTSVISDYANGVLARNATATTKARSAVVPIHNEADLQFVRDLDLNSPIKVFLHDNTTSQDLRVTGMEHSIDGDKWSVTLTFGPLFAVSRPAVPPGTGIPLIPDNFVPKTAVDFNARDLGAVQTFRQGTAPTPVLAGDTWFNTSNGNQQQRWSGTAWEPVRDAGIATADSKAQQGINDALAALNRANAVKDQIDSRGADLVTNGSGALGNNTNFSTWTFFSNNVPAGAAGAFSAPAGAATARFLDELVPVNITRKYRLSADRIQLGTVGSGSRMFLAPYDNFKLAISPQHYMFEPNTLTTLAVALNPGDTTVTLTDSTNWYGKAGKPANANTHMRSIIWWDYTDPGGKTWAPETYSRNWTGYDTWLDGGITGNVITLKVPYTGAAKAAGTKLSNGSAGATYMYGDTGYFDTPKSWTNYSAEFVNKVVAPGQVPASFTAGWPASTAYAKIGFLLNYTGTISTSQHAVANVSLSDAAAAQATAEGAQTSANGKSRVTYGSTPPTASTPGRPGDIFWVRTGSTITAQFQCTAGTDTFSGNTWESQGLGHQTIATLDMGKATVGELSGQFIKADAIGVKHTITGALFQTEATANRGIKFNSAALAAFDAAGNATLTINAATGAIDMKGNLTSGSTITGAEVKGSTVVVGDEGGFHTRHSAAIINGGPRATIRFHNGLKAYADIFAQDDDDQNEALKIQAGDGTFFSPKLWLRGANSYLELKGDVRIMAGGGRSFWIDARPNETTILQKALEVTGEGRVWARNLAELTGGAALKVGTSGHVFKDGSASRLKINVEQMETAHLSSVLNVPVKSWYDRTASEAYADALTAGETEFDDLEPLRRIPGVIAEDVAAAGLTEFVHYAADGTVEGVAYDRLAVALIPVVKGLMERITALEARP